MTVVDSLKKIGVQLPEPETADGISSTAILDKIKTYIAKGDAVHMDTECIDCEFLEILTTYPKSMTNRYLGDKLQLLIALVYEEGKPSPEQIAEHEAEIKEAKKEYSYLSTESARKRIFGNDYADDLENLWTYDLLALMFCCAKSSVNQAILKYGDQAQNMVQTARLKTTVHDAAMKELIEEEKQKLRNTDQNKQTEQPNDRTNTHNSSEEDNSARGPS